MTSWEITLTVGRVKDEHAAYVARVLDTLSNLFDLDGTDVQVSLSAERNRDGVERIFELVPEDPA